MRFKTLITVLCVLFLCFCKKKSPPAEETPAQNQNQNQNNNTNPGNGTQLIKIYDKDIATSGFIDLAVSFYYYDNSGRVNLIKEYDTTWNASNVVIKNNYKETSYTYNSFSKVTTETILSYSPSLTNTTNNYYFDSQQRVIRKIIYFNNSPSDSSIYTYLSPVKLVTKSFSSTDTTYVNVNNGNLDSTYYGSGYMYKYLNDGKTNPHKDLDNAMLPYKSDYNIKKIKTPFGNYNYIYSYNTLNLPAAYTTTLASGSGCNVTFFYH